MPATETEKTRLRRKLDGDSTAMPDLYIDDVFDEVETLYAAYSREVIVAAVYVAVIDDLLMKASRQFDYKISESEDKKSQVFTMLEKVRAKYQVQFDALIAKETPSPVRWGSLHKLPTRQKDYPNA